MPTHTQHNGNGNGNHTNPQIAVVMVPLPAQGHLNQLLHVARIISAASIPVYYVGAAIHIRQAKLRVHGWDDVDPSAVVNFHEISTPTFDNPPPNPNATNKFPSQLLPSLSASTHLRQPVHEFLTQLSTKFRRVVVISDSLMSYVVQDTDSIPNAEAYCFRCISAFTVYSFYWDAVGRPDLPAEAAVMREIPRLDDLFPQDFSEFARMQRGCRQVYSGDLYNSGREIEGLYLDLMEKSQATGVGKIWAVGPLNPVSLKNDSRKRHKCLEWLDEQEPDSVIFISFGTTTSLSDEQIQELAKGLEGSQQKFLWVVRDADKGDIFADEEGRTCELPAGFEERVRGRGMVVREWAPQVEVLGHPSTGGFMSHCGWNSCMESISNGVPIAAWPMHSDQPTNAVLVAEVLGIGVRVVDWVYRNEVVAAERIEDAVRKLMASGEGEEMRRKAKEFGSSLQMKGGGINNVEMASFIAHITR